MRPPPRRGRLLVILAGLALVIAAAVAWWLRSPATHVAPPSAATPRPPVAAAAEQPAIRHPIGAAAVASSPQTAPDVSSALDALFGSQAGSRLLRGDDFARRFVTTIDSLGRSHAPASLWPVHPVGGRLAVEQRGEAELVGADNGLRYTPYVLLLETLDLRRAAAAYVHLYPQFQKSYEELGYPNGYFNDRLVEVIDLLLATPEPATAPRVHVPAVSGPIEAQRPWLFYRFDDPALESLASGQKLLLRMGPVNERRVKARLTEIRRLVTSARDPLGTRRP